MKAVTADILVFFGNLRLKPREAFNYYYFFAYSFLSLKNIGVIKLGVAFELSAYKKKQKNHTKNTKQSTSLTCGNQGTLPLLSATPADQERSSAIVKNQHAPDAKSPL